MNPSVPFISTSTAVVARPAGGADLNAVLLTEDGAVEGLNGDLAGPQFSGGDHAVAREERLVRAGRAETRRRRAETEETGVSATARDLGASYLDRS